jgi:uncharacterized protein DUF5925/ATPase family protein associated with various cellular activities (AAA)
VTGADALPNRLGLRFNTEHAEVQQGLFLARVLERGLNELRSESWVTSAPLDVADVLFRHAHESHEAVLFEYERTLVSAVHAAGHFSATVAGTSHQDVAATFAALHERLPTPDPSSAHEVTVTFWTYGPHGPQPTWRSIAVPGWDEIHENYGARTRHELERLMIGFEPARGGQLLLWHGKPGTGKTFALRALAWEWRRWCEFHYIVDPDSFFGEHADYLMSVLLQPGYMEMGMHPRFGMVHATTFQLGVEEPEVLDDEARPKPWRVLLLEDTGELLSADARAMMGQGLSRFLNVVDGLIGQGLRVLALVTTNEEIRRLHPAVARPGRAAANVEFASLSADEAAAWFSARGVNEAPTEPIVLAELYARAEGGSAHSVDFGER